MGFGILRGQKCKLGDLKGMSIHIEREKKSRSNPDIDATKTKNNYEIIAMGDLNKKVKNRIAELPGQRTKTGKIRKVQDNAVMMYDFIVTGTHENIMAMSVEQQKKYFEDAVDFFSYKFGRENIMYAKVHNDERTPHLHLGLVPEFEGKLAAYKLFTPATMRDLQDEFFYQVSSRYGLDRGEIESERKHKTAIELKSETLAEVNDLKISLKKLKNETEKEKKNLEELKKSCVMNRVMRDDYAREAEINFKRLEKIKSESEKEKENLFDMKNNIEKITEHLKFLKNLAKICDSDEKKLDVVVNVIKQSNKNSKFETVYDSDGQMVLDKNGRPKTQLVGGAFDDLTPQKLLNALEGANILSNVLAKLAGKDEKWGGLVMYTKKNDFDDGNLLTEAEKDDRKAHQAFDNY